MTGHRRALLFMHHILSSKKRATIRDEARALGLVGLVKVGYPGVLIVQGHATNVVEYVSRIKKLRWQSCELKLTGSDELPSDQLAQTFSERIGRSGNAAGGWESHGARWWRLACLV
ncbi:hypothetical protein BKA62DRAFT_103421 [Auriculariales sp. MPI-PUGE-AT-0066]|nr:hypothetical protein BKA62DRAFT_103421 [Auriculariales sp. MPI-PUGE-AT-0066]